MSKKRLSVVEVNGKTWEGHLSEEKVPGLQLVGHWLWDAGFPVGARVEVEVVRPGRLVMTRRDVGGPLPSLLPLGWVSVERLASLEASEAGRG
jgi:Toxin SymE, type I toxin-antitoxin system